MKTVPVKTYYLEMRAHIRREIPLPREDLEIEMVPEPPLEFYRDLYDAVGRDWRWFDRKLMPDEELREILHDRLVEIHVLKVGGTLAGFAELDRRVDGEVEIAYFGLIPRFTGKGLGKYFLRWAIGKAWSHRPGRVWLHTCEWDHPAALATYRKAGFELYDEGYVDQVVPPGHHR